MLIYNSQLKKLILPEYGRNVQQMVDYCVQLEDRDERTHCACSIIDTMAQLLPQIKQEANWRHKLWDHLAIMSDFKLDIDFPYEIVQPDNLVSKPQPIAYKKEPIKGRHYGKLIEHMIARAAEYPEGEQRDALVMLIANHMKKLIFQISNEDVDDRKIFKDLAYYSHGEIRLDPETHALHEFQAAPKPANQGKKKKKKG